MPYIFFLVSSLYASSYVENLFTLSKENHLLFKQKKILLEKIMWELKEERSAFFPKTFLQGTGFYGNNTLQGESGFNRFDRQFQLKFKQVLYSAHKLKIHENNKKNKPQLVKYIQDQLIREHLSQLANVAFGYMSRELKKNLLTDQVIIEEKRLKWIEKRTRIGRNKKTDYLSSKAHLFGLYARKMELENEISISLHDLKIFVGKSFPYFTGKIEVIGNIPKSWEHKWFDHPKLQYLSERVEKERNDVLLEKSKRFPEVKFEGNAYLKRRQFGRKDDWDMAVNLEIPLWDFGQIQSKIQSQKKDVQLAVMKWVEEKDKLETQWSSLVKNYDNKRNLLKKFKNAEEVFEENYQLHIKEFRQGLINYIQVAKAHDEWITAKINEIHQELSLKELWIKMKVFVGEI